MKTKKLIIATLLLCPLLAHAQETTYTNEVIQTIMARRSIRSYQDKAVEHEKLDIIARMGILAPNGMNRQTWEVRVVESRPWIDSLTAAFVQKNPEMVKRDTNFKNMFRNAPNVIIIATPKGESLIEAGLLGENMILTAQSLGLGTCCLGGAVNFIANDPAAKPYLQQLQLPDGYSIAYMIAVGYPDEQPEARPRDESKIKFIQ